MSDYTPSEAGDVLVLREQVAAFPVPGGPNLDLYPGDIVMSLGVFEGREKIYLARGCLATLPEDETFYSIETRKLC